MTGPLLYTKPIHCWVILSSISFILHWSPGVHTDIDYSCFSAHKIIAVSTSLHCKTIAQSIELSMVAVFAVDLVVALNHVKIHVVELCLYV